MTLTEKEFVLDTLRRAGKSAAVNLQAESPSMTGTELCAAEEYIPNFQAARTAKNMLERKAGQKDGFVCRSSAGRVVRLLQVYDSEIYPQEPEELPAQWGFVWSTDPDKALPFLSLSTSPYAKGDCCTAGGKIWRSKIDTNTWSPETNPEFWEEVKK